MVHCGVKSAYRATIKSKRDGLFYLQQLLGHTSPEMARRYATLVVMRYLAIPMNEKLPSEALATGRQPYHNHF